MSDEFERDVVGLLTRLVEAQERVAVAQEAFLEEQRAFRKQAMAPAVARGVGIPVDNEKLLAAAHDLVSCLKAGVRPSGALDRLHDRLDDGHLAMFRSILLSAANHKPAEIIASLKGLDLPPESMKKVAFISESLEGLWKPLQECARILREEATA